MAPKGGRGGGGSSGGGSSGGSSSSYDEPSVWQETFEFAGSGFKDPAARAQIVVLAMTFLALLVIAIWSWSLKTRPGPTGKVFKGNRWGVAVGAAVVYFGFSLADALLEDLSATVSNVFFIFLPILDSAGTLAEVWLLGVIYSLYHVLANKDTKLHRSLRWAHIVFCVFLLLLYLAILSGNIVFYVDLVGYRAWLATSSFRLHLARLRVAYNALYFCATLEVCCLAVLLLISSIRGRQGGASKRTALLFLILIPAPLVIRTVFQLAVVVRRNYHKLLVTNAAFVAYIIVYSFCTIILYAGVLTVGLRHRKALATNHARGIEEPQYGPPPEISVGPQPQYGNGPFWGAEAPPPPQPLANGGGMYPGPTKSPGVAASSWPVQH
ncbi:MAG: hypothetical protein M1837_001917 [Sclerophora amabilis]|nr:MAG: hypothetical protein M1837_001917 [Sclerophora amabilis]